MNITPQEVAETLAMVSEQNLDLRTITMGISLNSCADDDLDRMCEKVYERIVRQAEHLVKVACDLEREYGIPIANKRVSVTPIAQIAACTNATDLSPLAHALDRAAETLGIDFLGGFSALVHKGMGDADRRLIASIPEALATTTRVCSSVNVASTRAGINMDAVLLMAQTVLEAARRTTDIQCYGAAKLVVFANMVEDSPFMAGAVHGGGEADAVINVGVSGPGVMAAALEELPAGADLMDVAEKIKATAFKITRVGELMSREASRRLGVEKGIVDLSLAPTPAAGDSVARILELIGVGECGGPGTTCALALLNDAVKKGGVMASSSVGGLSGAFIPVSEDAGMIRAAQDGALSLEPSHDLRVFGGSRYDCHPRRCLRRNHCRHYRRRNGHRRNQYQNHGRSSHSCHRLYGGRYAGIWRSLWLGSGNACQSFCRLNPCPPWRSIPGALEFA